MKNLIESIHLKNRMFDLDISFNDCTKNIIITGNSKSSSDVFIEYLMNYIKTPAGYHTFNGYKLNNYNTKNRDFLIKLGNYNSQINVAAQLNEYIYNRCASGSGSYKSCLDNTPGKTLATMLKAPMDSNNQLRYFNRSIGFMSVFGFILDFDNKKLQNNPSTRTLFGYYPYMSVPPDVEQGVLEYIKSQVSHCFLHTNSITTISLFDPREILVLHKKSTDTETAPVANYFFLSDLVKLYPDVPHEILWLLYQQNKLKVDENEYCH